MLPYIVGLVAAMVLTLFGVSTVKFSDLEPSTWLQQIASGLIYSTHLRHTISSTPAYSTPAPSAALLTSATPQPNVSNMTVWPMFEDYNVLDTSLITSTIVTPMHTPSTLSVFKAVFIYYLLPLSIVALVAASGYLSRPQVTCSTTIVALKTGLTKAVDRLSYWLKPHQKVLQEEDDHSSLESPCDGVENEITEIKRELSESKQAKKQSDQEIEKLQEELEEFRKQSDQKIKELQGESKDSKKQSDREIKELQEKSKESKKKSDQEINELQEELKESNKQSDQKINKLEEQQEKSKKQSLKDLAAANSKHDALQDSYNSLEKDAETLLNENREHEEYNGLRLLEMDTNTTLVNTNKMLVDDNIVLRNHAKADRVVAAKTRAEVTAELETKYKEVSDTEKTNTKRSENKVLSLEKEIRNQQTSTEQKKTLASEAHRKEIRTKDDELKKLSEEYTSLKRVSTKEVSTMKDQLQSAESKLEDLSKLHAEQVEGLERKADNSKRLHSRRQKRILRRGKTPKKVPRTLDAARPQNILRDCQGRLAATPAASNMEGAERPSKEFESASPGKPSDVDSDGGSSDPTDGALSSSTVGNMRDRSSPQVVMDEKSMNQIEIISNPPSSPEAITSGDLDPLNVDAPSSTSAVDSSETPTRAQSGDDANTSNPLSSPEGEDGCIENSNGAKVQDIPYGDDTPDMKDTEVSSIPVIANKIDSAAIVLDASFTGNPDYHAGQSKDSIPQIEHQAAITAADSGSNTGAASSSMVAPDPAESTRKETLDGDEELYDFDGNGKYIATNSPVTPNTSSPAADAAAEGEKKDVDFLCRDDSDKDGEFDGGFDLSEEISKGKGNGQTLPPSAKSVTAAHPNVGPSFDTQPPTSSTGTQSQDEQDAHMADEEEEDKMDEFDGSPEISPGSDDAEMGEATDDYGSAAGRPYFHHATPGPSTVPAVDQEIDMGEAQDWQLGNPSRTSPREAVTSASFPDPWPATPALTPTALQEKKLDTSRLAHPKLNQLSPARASPSAAKSTESSPSPFSPFKPKSKTGSQATPPKTMSFDPALSPFTTNTPAWTPIGPALSTSGSPDFKFSPASNPSPFSPFKPKSKTGSQATPPKAISSNPALSPFTTKTPAWTPIGPDSSSSGPPNVMFSPRSQTSSSPLSLRSPSSPYCLPGLSVPCTPLPSSPLAGLNSSPLPSSNPKSASPAPSAPRRSPSALPSTSLVAGGYDSGSESDEDEPLRPSVKLPTRKPVRAPVKLPAPKPMNYSLGFGNSLSNFDTAIPLPRGTFALPKPSAPANPAPVQEPVASQSKNKRSIEETASSETQKAEASTGNDDSSSTNAATNHAFTERTTGTFSSLLDFVNYKEETVTLTNGMQRQVRNPKSRHFQRLGL